MMKETYTSPQVTVVKFKVENGFDSLKGYSNQSGIKMLDLPEQTENVFSGTIYSDGQNNATNTSEGSWF